MAQDNWSPSNYSKHASWVPKLGSTILDILNPQPEEHILDFGCGDGVLTADLAQRCKTVIGIDASDRLISKAPRRSNITYFTIDGHDADAWFDKTKQTHFDAVFSNATLHWLKRDPVKAIQSIHHTLKPKGRFVAEFGGFMNCSDVGNALIGALNKRGLNGPSYWPWFFPSVETYSEMLTENGFEISSIELVPRLTELSTDITGWIETFGFTFLQALKTDQERKEVVTEIQEYLRPCNQRNDGKWFVFYNRLRVVAIKK
ncbi:hypothetical protein G6F56_000358 [Rhizopus delemar]|nr:hypothetical protein G6F56_000358 [Rhizopus delemar]